MHRWDERTPATGSDLVTMTFEDGRVVLYDPTNPEAWLMTDGE